MFVVICMFFLPAVIYLVTGLTTTTLSMIAGICTLCLHYKNPHRRPPPWLRKMAFAVVCKSPPRLSSIVEEYTEPMTQNFTNHNNKHRKAMKPTTNVNGNQNNLQALNANRQENQRYDELIGKMDKMCHYLKTMYEQLTTTEEEKRNKEEWQQIAIMADKCFLIFFLVLMTVSCVILIFIYPSIGVAEEDKEWIDGKILKLHSVD